LDTIKWLTRRPPILYASIVSPPAGVKFTPLISPSTVIYSAKYPLYSKSEIEEWLTMQKSQIYYHRAHRKISFSWKTLFVEFFLFIPFCWLLILYAYPSITRLTSQFLIKWNAHSHPASTSSFTENAFVFGNITTPQMPGRYPTPLLTFTVFLLSVLLIMIITRTRIPKPIAIWVYFVCLVNLVSVLFFTFFPAYFPYTIQHFSELFIRTEISIWLFVPVILEASLLPLPSSKMTKFMAILFAVLYAVAFGVVRYVLFVQILVKFSYIFMAALFFCFGPFIDFIVVVGVYSFYVSLISKRINKDLRVWNWSY
jgi:hypothetical protein